jgi:hypothetical protein
MSVEHTAPAWWVPLVVRVFAERDTLQIVGSKLAVRLPPPGSWRSLAEMDATDPDQILAIASQFGPLTTSARSQAGESLHLWRWLIEEALRPLTAAWSETGEVSELFLVEGAREAARALQQRILSGHLAGGGLFEVGVDGQWVLQCRDTLTWWSLQGVQSVFHLEPMKRCRWCQTWFMAAGRRSDAGFCSRLHRSAFHQKRKPPSVWLEGF